MFILCDGFIVIDSRKDFLLAFTMWGFFFLTKENDFAIKASHVMYPVLFHNFLSFTEMSQFKYEQHHFMLCWALPVLLLPLHLIKLSVAK